MKIRYTSEDDAITITAANIYGGGGALRDDFRVIVAMPDADDCYDVTSLDILDVRRFLPLSPDNGYDPNSDTLTLGDKPAANYRIVDNGDFISYLQWFNDGSGWDIVALDLHNASIHLAPAVSAFQQGNPQLKTYEA